jgi:D-aminopeptidase
MSTPTPPRARDLFQFDGTTGSTNSIVDVTGVLVGHSDVPRNLPGYMTGVTAILPRGNKTRRARGYPYGRAHGRNPGIDTVVPAAWFTLNGDGEMTGTHCIEEFGILEGPIMLTNTLAVGTVRNAVIHYAYAQQQPIDPDDFGLNLPVVAETDDEWLNDILNDALQVTEKIAISAIKNATATANETPATPPEGNFGGGTSNTCYSWKGGIGTSSRSAIALYYWDEKNNQWSTLPSQGNPYTVGVLVQANQGTYWDLVIRGAPVGTWMTPPCSPDPPPPAGGPNPPPAPGPATPCPGETSSRATRKRKRRKNSIIVVIATDAPLLPSQLKRLARRAALGVGRTGTITNNDSGEIFIAFSTANLDVSQDKDLVSYSSVPDDCMDPLFEATVNATEEAILNALVAADTVTGRRNRTAWWIMDPNLQLQHPELKIPTLMSVMQYYRRAKGP